MPPPSRIGAPLPRSRDHVRLARYFANATYLVHCRGTFNHCGPCLRWSTGRAGPPGRHCAHFSCHCHDRDSLVALGRYYRLTIMETRAERTGPKGNCPVQVCQAPAADRVVRCRWGLSCLWRHRGCRDERGKHHWLFLPAFRTRSRRQVQLIRRIRCAPGASRSPVRDVAPATSGWPRAVLPADNKKCFPSGRKAR